MRPFPTRRRARSRSHVSPDPAPRRIPALLPGVALALALVLAGGCASQPVAPAAGHAAAAPGAGIKTNAPEQSAGFTFLGEAVVPKTLPAGVTPLSGDGSPVGGLSGLTYAPEAPNGSNRPNGGDYLAISDSRGEEEHGPVRVYRLAIDLATGGAGGAPRLGPHAARVVGVTELLDQGGMPCRSGTVDPEGIAAAPSGGIGGFYVSSEGIAQDGIDPFVRHYAADGQLLGALPLPSAYHPVGGTLRLAGADRPVVGRHAQGVRNNLGFEPLALTPPTGPAGAQYLFSGTENALAQDGPVATVDHGSRSRLLRWRLGADGSAIGPPEEWVYPVSPVAQAPTANHPQPDGLPVSGLVELIALGPDDLLSLERSYTAGVGTTVRLYRVRLADATPVTGRTAVPGAFGPVPVPAAKTLLLDVSATLAAHGVPTDNLEGMTFGPDLPDGRRTLLVVSDDNFSARQRTQVVAFAVAPAVVSVD